MPGTVDIDRVFRKAVGGEGREEVVNKRLSYSIDEVRVRAERALRGKCVR